MPNEKQTFEALISEDPFDDSVCGDHQNQLRSEALEVFDQSKQEATLVQPQSLSQHGTGRHLDWNLAYGYFAIIAACLIGIVALSFYRGKASTDDAIVNNQQAPSVTVDPSLIASLAALDSYRDEVSSEEFFGAIAMCQTDHEGRMLSRANRP
jgi:hypothetical protein